MSTAVSDMFLWTYPDEYAENVFESDPGFDEATGSGQPMSVDVDDIAEGEGYHRFVMRHGDDPDQGYHTNGNKKKRKKRSKSGVAVPARGCAITALQPPPSSCPHTGKYGKVEVVVRKHRHAAQELRLAA